MAKGDLEERVARKVETSIALDAGVADLIPYGQLEPLKAILTEKFGLQHAELEASALDMDSFRFSGVHGGRRWSLRVGAEKD